MNIKSIFTSNFIEFLNFVFITSPLTLVIPICQLKYVIRTLETFSTTMPRLPKGAYNRLLGLLHKKTAVEINTKVPMVQKILYDLDLSEDSNKSALDELLENNWRQKPMNSAVDDVRSHIQAPVSNLLRFSCKNAFVGDLDMENIFPINRERSYFLDLELRKGLLFLTIKARNPINLSFTGAYYLIFPNTAQACVYYMETRSKLINGMSLDLEFVQPQEQHLKKMASPLLDRDINRTLRDHKLGVDSDKVGVTPIEDIFACSQFKLRIINQLKHLDEDRTRISGHLVDPLFDLLSFFVDADIRKRLVLVRNLPFGVSEPALENLLWDYELDSQDDPQSSITRIETDPVRQSSRTLIKFNDVVDATRFVRNFHGRKWEKMLSRKDKALYEPLLCEIVN